MLRERDQVDTTITVALLGCGTVGTEVVRLLSEHRRDLTARAGADIELIGIAVRDLAAERDPVIDRSLLTTDAEALIDRAQVVIELIGGLEPAGTLVRRALARGATVITGNKALIAADGPALQAQAAASGADLYFEAAVAGAVPVVYGLRESLTGDRITRVMGIVNGTTNFILDQMTRTGASFAEALRIAQDKGFAEADPTADVDGHDAAAKAAIMASLAFHTRVPQHEVPTEGIRDITAQDIAAAAANNGVIKLVAIAERVIPSRQVVRVLDSDPEVAREVQAQRHSAVCEEHDECAGKEHISVRVHPAIIPADDPLAAVHDAFNAVVIEGEAAGRLMFYGQGAGGAPTASAVLSDVVAAVGHKAHGGNAPRELAYAQLPVMAAGRVETHALIRMQLCDDLGALAQVASVFGQCGVSIQSVYQDFHAELTVLTHQAPWDNICRAVEQLEQIAVVDRVTSVIRREGR